MLTQEQLEKITVDVSIKIYNSHMRVGKRGLRVVGKNPMGEDSLDADKRSEDILIKTLTQKRVPAKIVSEEHGIVELGKDFLVTDDGLDGSNRYRDYMAGDRSARYGTMFAIFQGSDPRYEDYILGCIIEHRAKRLLIASRGKGISVINLATGERFLVHTPFITELNPDRIRADTYSEAKHIQFIEDNYISKFPEIDLRSDKISLRSSAAHYIDFALGEADWVFECTRKHNLEIAAAYPFARERGGVMVSDDGKDIGPQKYFEFHYDPEDYEVVISGPSEESIKRLVLSRINKN